MLFQYGLLTYIEEKEHDPKTMYVLQDGPTHLYDDFLNNLCIFLSLQKFYISWKYYFDKSYYYVVDTRSPYFL